MAGIYGVLLKENKQRELYKQFYNADFSNTIQEEIEVGGFTFGRSVLNKFNDDRFLYENEDYIVCYEGINYSLTRTPHDFIEAFEQSQEDFISSLKGTFSGFIFSKKKNKIILFNDQLATKDIYYFYDKEVGFAFSSEMHVLSKLLRQNKISINYDYDGIYSLALYGQMFDEFTLVKEIKRLRYGSTLSYDLETKKLIADQYFKLEKKIEPQNLNLNDVIENVDRIMLKAIKEEWQKDTDNGYSEHLSLISGGMDSRVNALLAKKMGFQKINGYTYGNPNSSDVKIAQKVASENFESQLQFNLQNGDFFVENTLENYVKATDGLTHFTANAIIYNVMRSVNTTSYGVLHSGQIGDVPFGYFIKQNFDFKANKDKIGLTGFVQNRKYLEKLTFLNELTERYQGSDYEVFTYEQRQINGTLLGDRVFNNFIDHVAPFYDTELIEYTLSVPLKYKMNQRLYFEWLKAKHPEVLRYKWEKIGLKPNSNFNINYGRLIKKYVNGGKKYFGLKYDSMNPIANWFQKDSTILKQFDKLFQENITLIKDKELQRDLEKIYKDDIFEYRNRFGVITVLLAIRLHFYR
ncbi:asparagine synthase-related protein [Marixanthomonas ophiurae]|uniref:asparagine synthase (glutamine-hydrolyzing) n=1 Tax=Marixanthomonas ophiurae TaxID=387659 RepID=A0A3E1QAK3_9FLAO|nr:asparagine synthase-related protein [Marixanthomonas ophiurae]RFN59163.1 hypothetical protein DZ858_03555 [Marixanthomonas ophiurae]